MTLRPALALALVAGCSGSPSEAPPPPAAPPSMSAWYEDCARRTVPHPGDVDGWGGRDRWTPSARPGGWQAIGQCFLLEDM